MKTMQCGIVDYNLGLKRVLVGKLVKFEKGLMSVK